MVKCDRTHSILSGVQAAEGGEEPMVDRTGKGPFRAARKAAPLLLTAVLFLCVALAQGARFTELTQDQKSKNGAVVDVGHADDGYIQVKYRSSKKRIKVRVSCGDETYTYDLNQNGEFEVYPLQMGSGTYKVTVFEQVKGSQYQSVTSLSFKANIADEFSPYLYPNQYAWYGAESEAVAQANALCEGLTTDAQRFDAIHSFVTSRFMYDYILAMTVRSNTTYLPDVDKTLADRKGICFDFAALMCCMLRSQGIPTQMVIGYADSCYHAWNRVYVDGQWRLVDTTSEITSLIVRQYTPERRY